MDAGAAMVENHIYSNMVGCLKAFLASACFAVIPTLSSAQEKNIEGNSFEDFSQASLEAIGAFLGAEPYSGRDKSYEISRVFGECAALFLVVAEYSEPDLADFYKGYSRGSYMTGSVIWKNYSENSFEVLKGIRDSSIPSYRLSLKANDDSIAPKWNQCLELKQAQEWIVEYYRKNVF